jgi:hypothetical protein
MGEASARYVESEMTNSILIRLCHQLRQYALVFALLCGLALFFYVSPAKSSDTSGTTQNSGGYVGSRACAKCHESIYQSFSRTDMGRSMAEVTAPLLEKIPSSASIFDSKLDRHFELYTRDGNVYQSEYASTADGKEIFRESGKLEWLIGSGANGRGAIVKKGDYLFEAPLSFYSKDARWALSPGYEFGDYGFERPILAGCIACHSGQPRPVPDGNGRFRIPPFFELAIGCENCHGPGQAHILAARMGNPLGTITNPGDLSPWLADNICMSCHQSGDARVLQPGKGYRDFQPGTELGDILNIFLVPFNSRSVLKDDLLEHYLSMRLSKCYRNSGGRLACISCHDPHVEPSPQEAPAYFHQKCLTCHTEKSCALPLSIREHKKPADDCAGCHMPKRDVTVISHSVLTNHRIVAVAEEPFPDAAFHMTNGQLPDLIQLTANPSKPYSPPSQLVLLRAYGQVKLSHPEYRQRYWALAKQLQNTEAENVEVLEALADTTLQQTDASGAPLAIGYLERAIQYGAQNPADFEQLAKMLVATHRESEALNVLQHGMQLIPYYSEFYRLSAKIGFAVGAMPWACAVVGQGLENFPQDSVLRDFSSKCQAPRPPVRDQH